MKLNHIGIYPTYLGAIAAYNCIASEISLYLATLFLILDMTADFK